MTSNRPVSEMVCPFDETVAHELEVALDNYVDDPDDNGALNRLANNCVTIGYEFALRATPQPLSDDVVERDYTPKPISDDYAVDHISRADVVALAQRHMEPRLARHLVKQSGCADTAFAGFLLAAEHLRDDVLYRVHPSAAISSAGGVEEMRWQPIAEYDAMPSKRRPRLTVFYYPPERSGRTFLSATVEFNRNFGRRTCSHWMSLPEPPESTGK